MAENTTKDIWNDDDGAKEPPKKRRMLRKFLLVLLVLIAVLGLVLVAAWRDGTGFDALRRYFAYGTEAVGGEKTVYRYDTDNTNRFAQVGTGSLVILSDTSLRLLGPDGSEVWSANVKMNALALGQGGGLAVAYDIGGTALYVLDETGPRLELTSDGPLVSANLNGSGMLAVTTQISGTKGHVDVYGADMQVLFAFNAHRRFVADACVTEDGSYLAAVAVNFLFRGIGQHWRVTLDDEVIEDDFALVSMCNGRYYGGGSTPVPEARMDDGVLHTVLVKNISRVKFAGLFSAYSAGRYRSLPPEVIRVVTAKNVRIQSEDDIVTCLDGETIHSRDVRLTLSEKRLNFFGPKGCDPNYGAGPK